MRVLRRIPVGPSRGCLKTGAKASENKTREECRKTVTSLLFNLYGAPSRISPHEPEPEPEPELNHNHSQQMLRVI